MKKEQIAPEFDEQILNPCGNEIVCPVYTMPLHEFRFREFCQKNGLVTYLPLKKAWKINNYQSHGKPYSCTRTVLRPLFPSYVFVKIEPGLGPLLFSSKSILHVLPVSDLSSFLNEIHKVRSVELYGLQEPLEFNSCILEGERFMIDSGVWEGVSGWLKKRDNRFLWTVEVEFLHEFITAKINPSEYKMHRIDE